MQKTTIVGQTGSLRADCQSARAAIFNRRAGWHPAPHIPAGLVLLAAVALTFSACSKKEEKETEAPATVQVTAVTQASIHRIVAGDGALFPRDQASVMPKIAAPVEKFLVNRGDHVKAGQLLAVLESRDLTAEAAEGQAGLQQAESNLRATSDASVPESVVKAQTDVESARETTDAAKKVLDARQGLFKEGALAQRQVDEARVTWAQANAQYLSAQEHLRVLQGVAKLEQVKTATAQQAGAKAHHDTLQAQLSYAEIHSPIGGVIADRPLYAGEMATPGAPLLVVMDISRVVARVNIPQAEAARVKPGQPATVTMVDNGESMKGTVTVVSPATDANSTTVQIWIQVENPGERLKPGSSVHAAIVTEEVRNAMVVPVTAILPGEEGGTAVLVIDSESTAHLRTVDVGIREGNMAQLLNGVQPGESVVTVGGLGVEDKGKVKILTPKEEDEDVDENAPMAPAGKEGK
jgi:multidrug efflux pump subunit AcrA (membrane-fusion protein)